MYHTLDAATQSGEHEFRVVDYPIMKRPTPTQRSIHTSMEEEQNNSHALHRLRIATINYEPKASSKKNVYFLDTQNKENNS